MKWSIKEWNGLAYALSYYIAGVVMTWLTYRIFGWEYRHFFGLHHFVGFIFWVGGLVWLIRLLVFRLTKSGQALSVTAPIVHAVVLATCLLMVLQPWRKDPPEAPPDPKTRVTITIDSVTHKGYAVDGNGDTILRSDDDLEKEGQ